MAGEEVGAQPAAGAVGDHDQVGLDVRERDVGGMRRVSGTVRRWRGRPVFRSLPAGPRSHVYAPAVVEHGVDRGARAHGAGRERGGEEAVQPGAVHHDERRPGTGLDRPLVDGEQRPAVAIAQPPAGRQRCGTLAHRVAEPEGVQCPDAVGHEPDAGAGLPQLRAALEHGDRVPGPVQGHRRGEPAQSGPDHHDVHVHPLPSTSVEAT